jgi:hypothetical protein
MILVSPSAFHNRPMWQLSDSEAKCSRSLYLSEASTEWYRLSPVTLHHDMLCWTDSAFNFILAWLRRGPGKERGLEILCPQLRITPKYRTCILSCGHRSSISRSSPRPNTGPVTVVADIESSFPALSPRPLRSAPVRIGSHAGSTSSNLNLRAHKTVRWIIYIMAAVDNLT